MVCSMVNHIPAYAQPTHLILGTGIESINRYLTDIVNIFFYNIKNQVGGLCVGEVSIQPGAYYTSVFGVNF